MSFPKVIPKPVFQVIGLGLLLASFGLVAYWAATFSGPYALFAELFMDDEGYYDIMPALLLTTLAVLVPTLPLIFGLRAFSRMPSFQDEMTKLKDDPLLGGLFGPRKKVEVAEDLASTGSRIGACLIDRGLSIVVIAVTAPFGILLKEEVGGVIGIIAMGVFLVATLISLAYAYIRDAVDGRSIGRRLLGLQVVDVDSRKPIGGWRSFKREIILHFFPLNFIELILVFSDPNRRRLGDRWAKTIVVRRAPASARDVEVRSEAKGPWGPR